MEKETYNSLVEKVETLSKLINGGKGSGNFGHGGRPGKVGGSSQSGGFSKGQSVEVEYGGGKSKAKVLRKLSDKEKKDRAFLANPDAGDYYEVETDSGYKTIVWGAKIKDAGGNSKKASSKAKKEKSSKDSKKESVGPAKIAKKDVQKLLQPDHDRYTREVVDVKYDSDKDRYEAKTVVKFKDGSPNSKESWSTMPGGDPKKSSSWFVDNTPTWLEGLSERIDRAHGK